MASILLKSEAVASIEGVPPVVNTGGNFLTTSISPLAPKIDLL